MKKTYLILVAAAFTLVCATSVQAQLFEPGTQEVGLAGVVDFASTDGTRAIVDASYGMYLIDYLQVGGELTIKRSGNEKIYGVGCTTEYDFDFGVPVYPFAGGHLQLASYNNNESDGTAVVLGVKVGAMAFVSENVAVSTSMLGDWASASIYAEDEGTTDVDLQILFGLRYFY